MTPSSRVPRELRSTFQQVLTVLRLESEIISTTILEAEKEMKAVMDGITSAR